MSGEITFLGVGLMSLLFNTIKDFQSLKIDSRKNFVMTGFVLGYFLFTRTDLHLSLIGLGLVVVFNHFTKDIFGSGDQESLFWIVPGLLLVGFEWLVYFASFFFLFTGVYSLMRTWQKIPRETKTPGFMVLFGAFLLTTGTYVFNSVFAL